MKKYVHKDDDYTTDFSVFLDSLKEPKSIWTKFNRFLWRFYDRCIDPKNWYYRFRHIIKWIMWGFNPRDIWSLDYTAAKWILPRLMKLRDVKHGVPVCVYSILVEKGLCLEDNSSEQYQEFEKIWDEILSKMIKSFQMVVDDDYGKDYIKWSSEVNEGLKLFAEYFLCLWD